MHDDATKKRCSWVCVDPLMLQYHDREWGVQVHDDRKHFEFLVLEGAQAGLSWTIVLEDRYLAPATPELRQTLRKRGIPYDGGIRGFGICVNVELARS